MRTTGMAVFLPLDHSTKVDSTLTLFFSYTTPAGAGLLPGRGRDALTHGAHALCCMQENIRHCPRRPHLHVCNTTCVMMLEEGMVLDASPPPCHGVRPRTLLVLTVLVLTSCQTAY